MPNNLPDPLEALMQNRRMALTEYHRCEENRRDAVEALHRAATERDAWNSLLMRYNQAIRDLGGDPNAQDANLYPGPGPDTEEG